MEGGKVLSERVSVKQAAKELGMAPQGVRMQMLKGYIDIGCVLPAVQGEGNRYHIYRDKLDKHLGKTR